jgi:hypothetical protein
MAPGDVSESLSSLATISDIPTSAREQQVLDFFASWGESYEAFLAAFPRLLADDCVWDQRPIPRLTGPTQAVRFLKLARAMATSVARLTTWPIAAIQRRR